MSDGVLGRLGQGRDEGKFGGTGPHITDDDRADGHAVAAFNADDRLGDRGLEGVGGLGVTGVEPGTQLAFLGQGDCAHPRGILRGRPDEREGLQDGVVQVGGDVRALRLAHALRLRFGQFLSRAQPHGDQREEDSGDEGGTDESAAEQDDRRVVTRGDHDDAEAEQADPTENRADETDGPPVAHLSALAPHQGDANDDRDDGPQVTPIDRSRGVEENEDDGGDQERDTGGDQPVA